MTEEVTAPGVETEPPATTELKELNHNCPYRVGAADWTVPDIIALREEVFANFNLQGVSHICLIISLGRQEQIMREAGVRYNDDYPFPFWYFIGKMISRALFQKDDCLEIMNYIPVRQIEYVGFSTRAFLDGEMTKINALEVTFKRPQTGAPMECFWRPARQLVIDKIQHWIDDPVSVG